MYGYGRYAHRCRLLERNQSTGICWVTQNNGNGCMCARGGYGGKSMCTTGSSYTVVTEHKVLRTVRCNNDNCGLVCNVCTDGNTESWQACAYGGDIVNRCGQFLLCILPDVAPTVNVDSNNTFHSQDNLLLTVR